MMTSAVIGIALTSAGSSLFAQQLPGEHLRQELICGDRSLMSDPEHPLHGLRAFVELNTLQPAAPGIELLVQLENEGSRAIDLVDLHHWVSVRVWNSKGLEIGTDGFENPSMRKEPPSSGSFDSESPGARPLSSGKGYPNVRTIQRVPQKEPVRLEVGEKLQLCVRKKQILADPGQRLAAENGAYEGWSPEELARLEPWRMAWIGPGEYRLDVHVSGISGNRLWEFDTPERITVQLLSPRDAKALSPGLRQSVCRGVEGDPSQPSAIVREELRSWGLDRRKEFPDHPLAHVRAFVEYQRQQPAKGGLVVVLELSNEGPQPIELVRVTESIIIRVFRPDNVQVEVPDPREPMDKRVGPRPPKKERRSFKLMHPPWAWRNPKLKVLQALKDDAIRLEPGEGFQTGVLLEKVMCDPDAWSAEIAKRSVPIEQAPPGLGPLPDPDECDIPPGEYWFAVSIGTTLAGEDRGWGFGNDDPLTVELLDHWPPKEKAARPRPSD